MASLHVNQEFGRLAHDGLLLEGKVEEYEKAFSGVDVEDQGVISKDGAAASELLGPAGVGCWFCCFVASGTSFFLGGKRIAVVCCHCRRCCCCWW